YARTHRREIEQRGVFMFNADSCGSISGWTQINFTGPDKLEALLKQHFQRQDIYCKFSHDLVPYIDQFPFAVCGVPGLWLERLNCTAGMFYHHRPENSFDKISPEVLAGYVNAAAGFIADLANADKLPPGGVPLVQRAEIEKCWQDLFGGW
ncbi:MAG: hypothetical protein PHV59_02365, partial [Victivallales bacterium]|nr:hypothetical protein [Victivallales bacterium]